MQPDGMYWMDEDGFGIEDDCSLYFYSIVNKNGQFKDKFKIYEIDRTCYNHDFDDIVVKYEY